MATRTGAVGSQSRHGTRRYEILTPSAIRLATPPDWTETDLLALFQEDAISQLIDERLKQLTEGAPAASPDDDLLRVLSATAASLQLPGIVSAFLLSCSTPDGLSLQATVTAAVTPPQLEDEPSPESAPEGLEARIEAQLAASIAAEGESAAVARVRLGAGPAVRLATIRPAFMLDDGPGVLVLTLRYIVPIPASPKSLLLTFVTPQVAIAEEFVQLFEAIAATVRFE